MTAEFSRDLGRHDEAIERPQSDVRDMRESLKRIEETLSETKGGLRMLIAVGSIGGAVGAALVKAIATIKGG